MSEPIEFYYDFVSPYSYFAFSQRHEVREWTGREVRLMPVSVGAIMKSVGNVPTSITCKAKRQYLAQDVARWAQKLRVPLRPHPRFGAFSTTPLILAALRAGVEVEEFSKAAFAAVWQEAAPVHDEAAMTDWLAAKDPSFSVFWAEREQMATAFENRVREAVERGAFGVPYFYSENGAFFGNDRIEFLVEALAP